MPGTVLLSSAYFPPIRYFSKILHYEQVYIESDENYCKQTYRNRCNILSSNGLLALTIPVLRSESVKIPISNLYIDQGSRWKAIHWRAIESAYRNSPFYLYYADELKDAFFSPVDKLFDFNFFLLKNILELLGLQKEIKFTESFKKIDVDFDDYSNLIKPKNQQKDDHFILEPYYQVFEQKFGFVAELSILDLLFNLGPSAEGHIRKSFR